MSDINLQKPFLKWVGGKTQIINTIISEFPIEINNYHELFLGGGSVLFALLSLQKQKKRTIKNKIYAYDINKILINVYKHIQNNKEELFNFINKYITEYDNIKIHSKPPKSTKEFLNGRKLNTLSKEDYEEYERLKEAMKLYRYPINFDDAKISKESYYYWVRVKYNNIDKNSIECSALFMFINKTCFRGMYREGPNGYNVPYGNYKKTPTIITKCELDKISDLIKDVEFIHSDFVSSIKNAKRGDLVYLDPPYAPENENSFVGYMSDGFNLETHKILFNEIKKLGNNNIKFVMSNAKVDLVTSTFTDYTCDEIIARRAINSKKPGSTTLEVIIYN